MEEDERETEAIDQQVPRRVCFSAFSFMNTSEARNLSIKQITNSLTFDLLKQPVPNGLYDPALGPVDKFSTYVLVLTMLVMFTCLCGCLSIVFF